MSFLKRLFRENAAKNVITLFAKANNAPSTRIQTLLKQAQTVAGDQTQNAKFDFEVNEQPPTSDQLRSILEFVGSQNAGTVITGASDEADAQRRLRADANALNRPLVVDWNSGKVIIGDNESEVKKLIKEQEN